MRSESCSPYTGPKKEMKRPVAKVELVIMARLVPIIVVEINHSGRSISLRACLAEKEPRPAKNLILLISEEIKAISPPE